MKKDTRKLLLDSAFQTFYKHGYQGANIASILSDVGINKGSMYYFFKSKKTLALAVIKERIEQRLVDKYTKILGEENSLNSLFETLKNAPNILPFGCPLNKMSQEMVYIDDDFKKVLAEVYISFEKSITQILSKVNVPDASKNAKLIISTYEGALMIYHLNQDNVQFEESLEVLRTTLI